jgi:ATP-dependent DNA helicase RecQ
MRDLVESLHRFFGHNGFRGGQQELVETVLDGQDLLAVMPTGSGKSLGFQLPALLLPGTTLVVSPLISLMKDQVDELNRRGVGAAALHSMLSADTRREVYRAARAGTCRLLYVAPERFASAHFVSTLRDIPVARFVVDEAHCVSEWGHDFRPDYRRLKDAAGVCRRSDGRAGRPPMAAFTATATPEVRDDIVALLGLAQPRIVVAGFDRPNITLHVRPVGGETEKHELLPTLVGTGRALVYASTRRKAEMAADTLISTGFEAAAYHAGLPDTERSRVQERFASGALRIVCATNAFGMGIDRPDVETVVHMDIPGSLEAYYQEIGRAGRDGRQSVATLLWNYADVKTREFLIDRENEEDAQRAAMRPDPAEIERRKELDRRKLRRMVSYADAAGCLRATILRYFGDPAAHEPCDACGNCLRRQRLDDEQRLLVRKILSGVARAGERFGRRKIAAMLVGQLDDLPDSLTRLSTTGLLRHESLQSIERWLDASVSAGLLQASDDQYRTLRLSPLGRDVMSGRVEDVQIAVPAGRTLRSAKGKRGRSRNGLRLQVSAVPLEPVKGSALDIPAKPSTGSSVSLARSARQPVVRSSQRVQHSRLSPHNGLIAAALRSWRVAEARRQGVAPFVILHDRTLTAIASALPLTSNDLLAIPGIGPAKLAVYGDAILKIVESSKVKGQS